MKKFILAIACVATLAFVAASQAADVTFLSRGPNGVTPSTGVHYTVMDQNGNKVAEQTVNTAKAPVQISGLPEGDYFLSAEETSTGYFGNQNISVSPGSEGATFVFGDDGLKEYDPNAPQNPIPPQAQPAAPTPANPANTPIYPDPTMPYPPAGSGSNLGALGALGIAAGIGGLVAGIVAIADDDKSTSKLAR